MAVTSSPRKKASRPEPVPLAFLAIYRASPLDRIGIIKAGIPARDVKLLSQSLSVDQQVMLNALNLKTATVNRKVAQNERLSVEDGERVLGLAKLVGQLEAMLEDAGGAKGFDAPSWMSRWLREPLPALGGSRPIDLLDTMEGQALVSSALSRIQSGAYA
jgi:putative toxin-antitoxin system antitoxin component (TIGR02293 family)